MSRQVNLLPPAEQKAVKQIAVNRELLTFGAWLIVSLVIVGLVLLATMLVLRSQLSSARTEIQQKAEELNQLEREFLQDEVVLLNQDLENFEKLLEQNLAWSGALQEIAQLLPKDMTLDELTIDTSEGAVEAKGRAETRESVLGFRESLQQSIYFRNVNFPLSNLEDATSATWEYRFFVNPESINKN